MSNASEVCFLLIFKKSQFFNRKQLSFIYNSGNKTFLQVCPLGATLKITFTLLKIGTGRSTEEQQTHD
ncbi:MAG: hypothetical protein DSY50_06005 [Desulfobulbus sp.]|nr:MAG: hypothetical protein DSY50_06005 [Desulfobulbus sp.]RUM39488.1 MAG: hypothetical protein DSY58_00385 [Desulfobulbus sp.]